MVVRMQSSYEESSGGMMSCMRTVEGRQTEFDFFQQLVSTPSGDICCGPLTHVVFDEMSMRNLLVLLGSINLGDDYLDRFDLKVLDSHNLRLTMCARHWLQHVDIVHQASHTYHRHDWEDIAFYVYKSTMLLNGWDEKELSNYLR